MGFPVPLGIKQIFYIDSSRETLPFLRRLLKKVQPAFTPHYIAADILKLPLRSRGTQRRKLIAIANDVLTHLHPSEHAEAVSGMMHIADRILITDRERTVNPEHNKINVGELADILRKGGYRVSISHRYTVTASKQGKTPSIALKVKKKNLTPDMEIYRVLTAVRRRERRTINKPLGRK